MLNLIMLITHTIGEVHLRIVTDGKSSCVSCCGSPRSQIVAAKLVHLAKSHEYFKYPISDLVILVIMPFTTYLPKCYIKIAFLIEYRHFL